MLITERGLSRAFRAALVLALLALAVVLVQAVRPGGHRGLRLSGYPTPLSLEAAVTPGERDTAFRARWSGVWRVGQPGVHRVSVSTEGGVRLLVGSEIVLERKPGARHWRTQATVSLPAGPRELVVELEGPARELRVEVADPGGSLRPFGRNELWTEPLSPAANALVGAASWAERILPVLLGAAALLGLLALALGGQRDPAGVEPVLRRLPVALVVVVSLLGAALRLEALFDRYWVSERPAFAEGLLPLLRALHPEDVRFTVQDRPYEGDPVAYLRHARQMRYFHEARFREPMFVAAAKLGLWACGGKDIGISLASATFSALTVPAVYALGAAAVHPVAGLVAAAGFAFDQRVVHWSVEGWRDDAFAFFAVLTTLGALRLYRDNRFLHAVFLGFAAAAATLTRITALSLVVPLLLMLAFIPRSRPRRARLRTVAVAAAIVTALVAPFLVNCWRVYGDPLLSINAVTVAYYERTPEGPKASVVDMLRRFGFWQLLDTSFLGYTVYPFATKWHFEGFSAWLGPLLAGLALPGAALLLLWLGGRILWLGWAAAMLPFVFTWRVRGGDAWRLTLHAYPYYLMAAATTLCAAWGLVRFPEWRRQVREALRGRRLAAALGLALAVAATFAFGTYGLYYLVAREAVLAGREAVIAASPRDRLFFGEGFYPQVATPNQPVRCARAGRTVMRLPLRPGFDHRVVLRLLPPGRPPVAQTIELAVNGQAVGRLLLSADASRFGTYEARVPAAAVRPSGNRLELRSPAGRAGALVEGVDPTWEVGFVLWYVSVTPIAPEITGTRREQEAS